MKIKLLFLLTFSLLQISCNTEQNFIQYYQYINSAKEAVLNRDFTKADRYYEKALNFNFVYAKDKFAALQLSAKLDNKATFIKRYQYFIKSGGTYSYIIKDSIIEGYLKKRNHL